MHGSDILPAGDEQGAAKKRSNHWNFQKILIAFAVQRGKALPIRIFKTLPDYSLMMFHRFFANLFCLSSVDS